MKRFVDFDIILISPKVKIKRFPFLKNFFFFHMTKLTKKFFQQYLLNLKIKLKLLNAFMS